MTINEQGRGRATKTFAIFQLRQNRQAGETPYERIGYWHGRTAADALTRFAADRGLTIGERANHDGHWIDGRTRLSSFGRGQFSAMHVGIPVEEPVN